MPSRDLKVLGEGKTKIIYDIGDPDRPGVALIHSKDIITAGDGVKRNTMEGKSVTSNRTACLIFGYLTEIGIKNHFLGKHDDVSFLARRCHMIPLEFVTRRLATGSFLKRNPGVPEGYTFSPPKLETFFKDDENHDPQWSTEQIIAKKFTYTAEKGGIKKEVVIGADEIHLMLQQTRTIFEVLEKAWRTRDCVLVDMKIEFGVDAETGEIILADIIDSDSWRLWPHGDKLQMKDKQVYRDAKEVNEDKLKQVKLNFDWIADQLMDMFGSKHKVNGRVVIFMGSASDLNWAKSIQKEVEPFGIDTVLRVTSAHKTTEDALRAAAVYDADDVPTVFIAVAGRSNGLGPVLSGNVTSPVINCPPPSERIAEDVWSSLRLPTGLSCATLLTADAAALHAANIIALTDYKVWSKLKARQYKQQAAIIGANGGM
ncbi:multifunctional protein ADE2-like [Paramacrobiotus metropolitanus]|uniref:multifunctional protein ADE2-like n=1 Tax=Paramacrobiotus metropolitanus TaxID=2943436 RepID=UPI002445D701|nr:multifunctional protein ADE2-like [Paramacrobiotus metropolitanus]